MSSTTRPPRTAAGRSLIDLWIAESEVPGQLDWLRLNSAVVAIEAEAAAPDAGLRQLLHELATAADAMLTAEAFESANERRLIAAVQDARHALAHRSSDPSPATYTEVERLDRPGNRANLEESDRE